jgi:hypothetical protein
MDIHQMYNPSPETMPRMSIVHVSLPGDMEEILTWKSQMNARAAEYAMIACLPNGLGAAHIHQMGIPETGLVPAFLHLASCQSNCVEEILVCQFNIKMGILFCGRSRRR